MNSPAAAPVGVSHHLFDMKPMEHFSPFRLAGRQHLTLVNAPLTNAGFFCILSTTPDSTACSRTLWLFFFRLLCRLLFPLKGSVLSPLCFSFYLLPLGVFFFLICFCGVNDHRQTVDFQIHISSQHLLTYHPIPYGQSPSNILT